MLRISLIVCGLIAASIFSFGAGAANTVNKSNLAEIIANNAPISPDEARLKTDTITSIIAPGKAPQTITPQSAKAQADAAVKDLETLQHYSADRSFERGEWDKTITSLDKSIVLNNEGVDKYALAAWLLWSTGKHDEAISYYNKMVLANPNNPDAYFEYGFYYVTQKNDQEAVRWLQTAVALGLKSPKRHMYGHALKRLGMKDEALTFWKKVLVEEPGNEVARNEVEKLLNPGVAKTTDTPTAVPPIDVLLPTPVPVQPLPAPIAITQTQLPTPSTNANIKDPVMK